MTTKKLSVGFQSQTQTLIIGPALEPMQLLRHCGGIRVQKGDVIELRVEVFGIQLARLCVMNDLSGFVEALQKYESACKTLVITDTIGFKSHGLPKDF